MSKLILIMGDSGSGKNNYKIYKLIPNGAMA